MFHQGLVQAQVFADGFDGGDVIPLTEHHAGRVARQDVKQDENEGHDSQEHEEAIRQPFQDEGQQ